MMFMGSVLICWPNYKKNNLKLLKRLQILDRLERHIDLIVID